MARVLLIRHCQSTGQRTDSPLTSLGRQQAVTLAAWLQERSIDRIISSPFQRAVDSIQPFATQSGLEVEVDERLAERALGGGWFATRQEMLDAVRAVMEDPELRLEGGETGLEVTARGWPALIEALDRSNAVTALVAHGLMNSHLLSDIDGTAGYDMWLAMTNPDVFDVWRDVEGLHYRHLWDEA
jgi:2,3-bisphosphoglycerate-dependent phosphoglycerate mutase